MKTRTVKEKLASFFLMQVLAKSFMRYSLKNVRMWHYFTELHFAKTKAKPRDVSNYNLFRWLNMQTPWLWMTVLASNAILCPWQWFPWQRGNDQWLIWCFLLPLPVRVGKWQQGKLGTGLRIAFSVGVCPPLLTRSKDKHDKIDNNKK